MDLFVVFIVSRFDKPEIVAKCPYTGSEEISERNIERNIGEKS
jgi:hypothetical protein